MKLKLIFMICDGINYISFTVIQKKSDPYILTFHFLHFSVLVQGDICNKKLEVQNRTINFQAKYFTQ